MTFEQKILFPNSNGNKAIIETGKREFQKGGFLGEGAFISGAYLQD